MARMKYLELRSISLMLLVSPFLLQLSLAQSSPNPPPIDGPGVDSIVTPAIFDQLFPQRDSFYTYEAFISASRSYNAFGRTGTSDDQSREIAAFLAHVSHETGALAKLIETDPLSDYCDALNTQYPCVPGQRYYGRGPLQISWNYNYGAAGQSPVILQDLLSTPNLVAQDPVVSFQTALWFWTTTQLPKPSCHDVMIGNWIPSADDTAAGRQAGFGLTIDIINGGKECGPAAPVDGQKKASARVSLFQSISSTLRVDPGTNLDCQTMQPYPT